MGGGGVGSRLLCMISLGWCPRVFMSCAGGRRGVTRHTSLVSSSCLELQAPPRMVGRVPGALAPGQMGWLAGLDCFLPRVCSGGQKEWTCQPQGSVTPCPEP